MRGMGSWFSRRNKPQITLITPISLEVGTRGSRVRLGRVGMLPTHNLGTAARRPSHKNVNESRKLFESKRAVHSISSMNSLK